MSLDFDVRTAYLLLGVVCLGGALGVHASLRARSRPRHQTWAWGGICFGGALVMVALRGWVPELVTYELSHLLFAGAFLLQASALRAEVGRGWRASSLAAVLAVSGTLYAALTALDRGWGLMFNSVVIATGSAVLVGTAYRIWHRNRQLPALVIALGFGLLLLALAARILDLVRTSLGRGGPFESGVTQITLMMGGLFAVILGHLGYLGLQFLRMAAEQVEAERAAAMEAERSRQVRERALALHELVEQRNELIQRIARSEAANDLALFATSLPHELSQPLCAAKLNLDSLRTALEPLGEGELLDLVQAVDTSHARVLDLLQQLRILLQTQEVAGSEDLDLRALVLRTLPVIEGSLRERRVRLVTVLAEGLLPLRASATQLQQLLIILCAHALDDLRRRPPPAGREPSVQVSLGGDARQLCLRVEDSGSAGAGELLARLDGAAALRGESAGEGRDHLGVGFAVAQRVAQAHQGELRIEDSALGGVAFVLTLPTAAVVQAASEAAPVLSPRRSQLPA